MEKIRKQLLIAAILCILFGIITAGIPIFAAIEIILGGFIIYVRNQDDKALQDKRKYLTIIAIILLIFNQISAIILFLAIDNIDAITKESIRAGPENNNGQSITSKENQLDKTATQQPVKEKPQIDPELKKIDILLKLGVAMVAISGLLFATTSWDLITNPIKVLALVFMGILFIGLSKFSEKKLHIETTTFTYWLLAMFFFIFSIVAIGTLGIFGTWLTYTGDGRSLMYAITYALIASLSYLTYRKKNNEIFKYIMYTGILITLYNLLRLCTFERLLSISIITVILFLINITQKDRVNLHKFAIGTSYVLAWTPILIIEESTILTAIACILNIININYVSQEKDAPEEILSIISAIFSYVLLTRVIELLNFDGYNYPIAILLYTIFALALKYGKINNNKTYQITNHILYYVFAILYFIMAEAETPMIILLSSTLILGFNLINTFIDKKEKITTYIQPTTIFLFVLSISNCIVSEIELNNISVMGILALIYTIIYHFVEDKNKRTVYYWSSLISIILSIFISLANLEKITSLITLICLIYHYLLEENDRKRIFLYIGTLVNIYISLVILELLPLPIIYNALITLWLYVLIKFLLKETKTIESITSIAMVIPAYTIVSNLTIAYEYQAILNTTLSFYVLYLIVTLLIQKQETKNFVSIGGIALLLLMILEANIIIGVYIGIVGIIVMMIGFNKVEYKELFITGIVITVVNIIYQLQDLWEKIPFWLYLLVTGLGLIGFVTYKEIKKMEQKENIKSIRNEDNKESTLEKVENKVTALEKFKISEVEQIDVSEKEEIQKEKTPETNDNLSHNSKNSEHNN